VGHAIEPVRDGAIDQWQLKDAVLRNCTANICERQLREFLNCDEPVAPLRLPATVAVCTRDRVDELDRCLTALGGLPDDGQEVLVIDSASKDPSAVLEVVSRFRNARCIRIERPGLDLARNVALQQARHEIVAFADDDTAPDPGWLRALVRNFRNGRTLCVTGLTLPAELETPAQEYFEQIGGFSRGYERFVCDGLSADPFDVSKLGAGANMALRRSALSLVGSFDEALDAGTATRSGGDHDMFTRILSAGYRIVYDPTAVTWHRHRRDWHELRDTIRGYGTGVVAYLTAQLVRGEPGAIRVGLGWMLWQILDLARSLLGCTRTMPMDLAIAQFAGCMAGPAAYIKARLAGRRSILTDSRK
jgi:GT2 family glycosyltransferase